jgi:DNA (cytosine-5)-methyltransferase 1
MQLVLSLFTGLGMLDNGFEQNGFCVVSAGDIITNKDVANFKPMANKFNGIIGGSPCQDFSKLRRTQPSGNGLKMIDEFKRIVLESNCDWFLLENVPTAPNIEIQGYHVQRFNLCPTQLGFAQSRNRKFQFGSKKGYRIVIEQHPKPTLKSPCITTSKNQNIQNMALLQGFTDVPNLSEFKTNSQKKLIGNGVHLGVSKTIAKSIKESITKELLLGDLKTCYCGCGFEIKGKAKFYSNNCRQRHFQSQKRKQHEKETNNATHS